MRSLGAIYIIWYRDVLRFWRDKMRLLGAIAFPLMFLVIFGSGLSGAMGMMAPGVDFAKFMFPGVIGMTVLMTSFMSGLSIVWDREFGFLKEVLVAPISRAAVATGKTLGGATIAMCQGSLILIFAPFLGVSLSLLLVLKLLPLMLIMACALSGMGILIASRMKSMEAFQVVTQMLMMPMIFLSGIFFPVNNLPPWLNVLVRVNPVSYGVDSIRQLILGSIQGTAPALPPGMPNMTFSLVVFNHTMTIVEDMAVMAGFGLVMVILAMWSFSAQE